MGLFNNWFISFAIFSSIGLQILIMEVPMFSHLMKIESIPMIHILLLLLVSFPIIIIMEIFKYIKRREKIEN